MCDGFPNQRGASWPRFASPVVSAKAGLTPATPVSSTIRNIWLVDLMFSSVLFVGPEPLARPDPDLDSAGAGSGSDFSY